MREKIGMIWIDDQPVGNISVTAYYYDSWQWGGAAHTDRDGSYVITGLAQGIYRIEVHTYGTDYAKEYYDNVYFSDSAARVEVTAGIETEHINFSLVLGGVIKGTLYKSDGITPVDSSVGIQAVSGNPCGRYDWIKSTSSDPETGNYEIRGILPGINVYLKTYNSQQSSYIEEWYAGSESAVLCADSESVVLSSGGLLEGMDFQLEPVMMEHIPCVDSIPAITSFIPIQMKLNLKRSITIMYWIVI